MLLGQRKNTSLKFKNGGTASTLSLDHPYPTSEVVAEDMRGCGTHVYGSEMSLGYARLDR
jgi:hypothetical protein